MADDREIHTTSQSSRHLADLTITTADLAVAIIALTAASFRLQLRSAFPLTSHSAHACCV